MADYELIQTKNQKTSVENENPKRKKKERRKRKNVKMS